MQKQLIIVTGKDGQLGYELMQLNEQYDQQYDRQCEEWNQEWNQEINYCKNGPIPINQLNEIPFYINYTIDPYGQLFGNSQCGELNYTKYMVFYPPSVPLNFS
jgi:hypothetical protein